MWREFQTTYGHILPIKNLTRKGDLCYDHINRSTSHPRVCCYLDGIDMVKEKNTETVRRSIKRSIENKIERALTKEFYCSQKELNEKTTIYSINPDTEQPYIKILAYKDHVVICTSECLYSKTRKILQDKTRDEIFEFPLVYGQTIHYVPDEGCLEENSTSSDYACESFFGEDVFCLRGLTGFENALAFDENGQTATRAVCVARDEGRVIGVAGAAGSAVPDLWEIGVDVLEGYRKAGLGTHLVRTLTEALLAREIVPFYSASITNIGSQMVAYRCGYKPCWVDTFGTILDGNSVYDDLVKDLSLQFENVFHTVQLSSICETKAQHSA